MSATPTIDYSAIFDLAPVGIMCVSATTSTHHRLQPDHGQYVWLRERTIAVMNLFLLLYPSNDEFERTGQRLRPSSMPRAIIPMNAS